MKIKHNQTGVIIEITKYGFEILRKEEWTALEENAAQLTNDVVEQIIEEQEEQLSELEEQELGEVETELTLNVLNEPPKELTRVKAVKQATDNKSKQTKNKK